MKYFEKNNNDRKVTGSAQRKMSLWAFLIVLAMSVLYCAPPDPNTGYRFLCNMARNGWKLCNQNRVRYCHIDHFHTGQNCEEHKLKCVENSEQSAVCIDETKSCQAGTSKCEKNIAYNCIDGSFSVEPCGTAKTCEVQDKKVYCKPKLEACGKNGELHDGKCECNTGYQLDPKDARNCIPK